MSRDAARQFAPLADAYAASASHASGRTLAMLLDRAAPRPGERVLDVGTGAGHTALAFAARGARVVALDVTPAMVARALRAAREAGTAVAGVVAPAESLPFPDTTFDAVTCRTAAHHFDDLQASLAEMRRVLRPGGRLALTDQAAAADPALRALQHAVEVLHDRTHRVTLTPSEWRERLAAAGFSAVQVEGGVEERLVESSTGTNVREWCARSRTPAADEAALRALLAGAPRDALGVRGEGDALAFDIYKLVVTARA